MTRSVPVGRHPRTHVASMNARTQGFVLLLFGGSLLRLGVSSQLLRYVRPNARTWVLLAGMALVWLAGIRLVQAHRARSSATAATGVGWLILAPVVAILVVGPPALGPYSAARASPLSLSASGQKSFPALTGTDPHVLGLLDFTARAVWDDGRTLTGDALSLTGFVLAQRPGGFVLARLVITCCAADAQPIEVEVRATSPPPGDAWVTVVGRYAGGDAGRVRLPVLSATSIAAVAQPTNPYE
jgi:uncharacterized repeat protein (TIGR03943 family)